MTFKAEFVWELVNLDDSLLICIESAGRKNGRPEYYFNQFDRYR
jgi:hypothetical protein